MNLTPLDRSSRDVRIVPGIVAELELGNTDMQVRFAGLVVGADAVALDQRPKALNRVGADCTNNIFTDAVIDGMAVEPAERTSA